MSNFLDNFSLILFFFLVILTIWSLLLLYSFSNPLRLMAKGKYAQAIKQMQKTLNAFTYRHYQTLRCSMIYNLAICYNRAGDLQRSRTVLDQIDLPNLKDKKLRYGYYCLYAGNLLLLEEEPEEAVEMLDKAIIICNTLELRPLLALGESCRGNFEAALEYIKSYQTSPDKEKKIVFSVRESTLIIDAFTLKVEYNYFIGLTYLKAGKQESAAPYFKKAAEWKFDNYYSTKAKKNLSRKLAIYPAI